MDKTVTVLLYGADRNPWKGKGAKLRVTDANRNGPINVLAEVDLKGAIVELDLTVLFDGGQTYVLTVQAPRHRTAWQVLWYPTFVREENGRKVEKPGAILRLMLVPDRATSADLGTGYDRLVDEHGGLAAIWTLTPAAYQKLDAARKMALLNIEAKLRDTLIGSNSLLSYVTGLRGIDPDRLFILVDPELKALVARSADFAGAEGHDVPKNFPKFPKHPDSWKHTLFSGGNIQLSFSESTEPWSVGKGQKSLPSFSVDVDIDLARGVDHASEWLDNNVIHPGQKTDQTQVYSLLFGQGIFPLYTLDEP